MKKQKKLVAVMLCMVMLVSALAGCGTGSTSAPVSSGPAASSESDSPSAPADTTEPEYIFKFSHHAPAVGVQNTGIDYFCSLVEEYSGGRIKMENYPAGQLAEKVATLEGLVVGTIELSEMASTDFTMYDDLWDVFAMPYLFDNGMQTVRVENDPRIRAMTDASAADMGFVILSWLNYSERNIINTLKPIETPDDMKGLKIRVMQSAALVDAMTALGAASITMPWTECYSAVQQGVLDAVENSTPVLTSNAFHEVCPYYSLTKHFIVSDQVFISKKVYDSLPADLQEVLIRAGKDYETHWNDVLWPAAEEEEMQMLIDYGTQINEPDLAPFMERAQTANEKTVSKFNERQKELYDLIMEVKKDY